MPAGLRTRPFGKKGRVYHHDPKLAQDRPWRGTVAQSFYETPEGRQLYKERLIEWGRAFYGNTFDLSKRVTALMKVIEPNLTGTERQRLIRAGRELEARLNSRKMSLPGFIERLEAE